MAVGGKSAVPETVTTRETGLPPSLLAYTTVSVAVRETVEPGCGLKATESVQALLPGTLPFCPAALRLQPLTEKSDGKLPPLEMENVAAR